jgi:hypothetical protein
LHYFIKINTMNYKQLFLFSGQVGKHSQKEPGISMGTAGVIRTILLVDIVIMAVLALAYLRQRRMSWSAFCCWGLLAIGVPVLGPFLVIANRPGEWDPSFSLAADFIQLIAWSRRLLPGAPPAKKLGTLERARLRRQKKRK